MFLSDNVREIKMIPEITSNKDTLITDTDKSIDKSVEIRTIIEELVEQYDNLPIYMKILKVFSFVKKITTTINNNKTKQ